MMLPLITMFVFGPYIRNRFGKLRDREAEVGPGVAAPLLVEVHPADAGDRHRREELRRLEPGAVDDDVDLVLDAVGRPDAGLGDLGDASGDQLDVLAGEVPAQIPLSRTNRFANGG